MSPKKEAFRNSPIKTHFQIDIFLARLSEFLNDLFYFNIEMKNGAFARRVTF